MLISKDLASSRHPGLHFIKNEQNLFFIADLTQGFYVFLACNIDAALTLDQLNDDSRCLRRDRGFDRVDIIKNNITLENICSLYCSSVKYNLSEFEDLCFNFAATKMSQILISEGFHEMDKNSVNKFMERAAKSNVFK